MTAFSDELAACALSLLTEFGEAVTFTRVAQGAYNPASATMLPGATSTFTGYGYPDNYSTRDVDGTIVQESDIRLFVNAVSTEPVRGDQVTVSSKNYRIIEAKKYSVSGSNVLYELQLRI